MTSQSPNEITVVQVCSSLSAGGLARIVLDLGGLPPERIRQSLIATVFPGIHWPQEAGGWADRIVIHRHGKFARYFELYKILRRVRPVIVHAHHEAYAPIIARLASVPVRIETIHSALHWLNLGHPLVRLLRRRSVTRHVAVSSGLRDELVGCGALRSDEVVAIPNGVPVGDMVPADRSLETPIIGTVSRLDPDKGLQALIRAFASIRNEWPQARLLLVGDGPGRHELEMLVEELGLGCCVEMPGYVNDPERWMRSFHIFVLPSLHEAFGLTLAQAMSLGVPVVSSDLPGPASICRGGIEGLLVPPGDAEAIATACRELLRDADLRNRLRRAARLRVEQYFSLERMREDYLALYTRLAAASPQNRATGQPS